MHGFIGELVGTFVLVVFGTGCCASLNLRKTYATGSNWLYICVFWGLAVTMGVYVAGSLGSLGHLNPAVTIGSAMFGFFPWNDVVPYLAGQFIGAFLGAVLVIIHFIPQFKASPNEAAGNSVGNFGTQPAIDSPFFNFFSETAGTFMFVIVLLNLGDFTQGLKPLIVGMIIMTVGGALGSTTGFAVNPARDWGPRLAYTILPVPNKGSAKWSYAWIPMCGPLLGGIIAAGLEAILK